MKRKLTDREWAAVWAMAAPHMPDNFEIRTEEVVSPLVNALRTYRIIETRLRAAPHEILSFGVEVGSVSVDEQGEWWFSDEELDAELARAVRSARPRPARAGPRQRPSRGGTRPTDENDESGD